MHFEVFCTNALVFVDGKPSMLLGTIASRLSTIMYIGGKPVSFLVFGQNVSKWMVNLQPHNRLALLQKCEANPRCALARKCNF